MTNGNKVITGVVVVFAVLIVAAILVGAYSSSLSGTSSTTVTQRTYPEPRGFVVDDAHVFGEPVFRDLTQKLTDLEKNTTIELAVVTVDSTSPDTIEQFSIALADKWKVGKKLEDNGVIFLTAVNDHKVRIEIGHGLEGDLTDAQTGAILDTYVIPKFKAGDISGGIQAGTEQLIKILSNIKK